MNKAIDQALENLVSKSRELLQDMEESLLQLEQSPDNIELINTIFHAAHAIKSSTGLFGLQVVMAAEAAGRQKPLKLASHNQALIDSLEPGKLSSGLFGDPVLLKDYNTGEVR